MTQFEYDTIVNCIKLGAPAIETKLILSFNEVVEIANNVKDKTDKEGE